MNPYRVLGVEPGADERTIRAAYRRYVAEHHPDRGGDPAAFQRGVDAFKELGEQPRRVPGTLGMYRRGHGVARLVREWTQHHRRRHRRVV